MFDWWLLKRELRNEHDHIQPYVWLVQRPRVKCRELLEVTNSSCIPTLSLIFLLFEVCVLQFHAFCPISQPLQTCLTVNMCLLSICPVPVFLVASRHLRHPNRLAIWSTVHVKSCLISSATYGMDRKALLQVEDNCCNTWMFAVCLKNVFKINLPF